MDPQKELNKMKEKINKNLEKQDKAMKEIKEKIDSEEFKKLQKCKKDKDCKNNEYCAFNENDEKHYCIPNKIYLGCLKNSDSMYRFLKATDKKYSENMDNCIDFARKLNNNEIIYDYIHFKPKVATPIKKKSINVNLKCGDAKIINLPYEDSFKEDCDANNENCKIVPKNNITKILENNLPNCAKDYHLNINYSCDVENIDKSKKVDLNKNNIKDLTFNLKCPVNEKNNKYESQCTLFSFKEEDNVNLDKIFDSNIVQQKCDYASYLIPNIINDINEYNLKKNKKLEKNMEKFNDIISADEEELNKKKALQYMVEHEKKFNSKISYDEALKYVKSTIENLTNEDATKVWDIKTTIPFINNESNYSKFTRIGGNNKLFTSTNAVDELQTFIQANYTSTTYPDYIVFFNNSTLNGSNAGKAFAISFDDLKNANKTDPTLWINNIQTTSGGTGGAAYTLVNVTQSALTKRATYYSDLVTTNYQDIQKEFDYSLQKLKDYQTLEENVINAKNDEIQKNINYMNQRIKNSNYQSDMNKKIIRYLYILLILVFIITLAYFVYMSQLSSVQIT